MLLMKNDALFKSQEEEKGGFYMRIEYLTSEEITEDVLEGLVETFFENRYEYAPNLYHRMNVDEKDVKKDENLKRKIKRDMEQRVKIGFGFWIVFDDYEVVGYNNHYINNHDEEHIKLEIGTTVIKPSYHGKGIGQQIYKRIEEMHEQNDKIKEVLRATWSTNERQKYLYEKNGYRIVEVIENHYGVEGIHKMTFSKKVN